MARNGVILIILAVGLVLLYNSFHWDGLFKIGLVALGLGMVIFIHELGHFLVAKWCDVHVETFSIGFGPPLPGCKFQRGETTYMIALFPLGGYVKMVGEGAENEEDDNDPRSFKNKAVWQRMAIISAGVFMNMVLGIGCFIFVYMAHGVERSPGVIGMVDSGSPTWKTGAPSGAKIDRIGNAIDPYFDQLMPEVALSSKGDQLDFVFNAPGQPPIKTTIEPRLSKGDDKPVIGVAPPDSTKLFPDKNKKTRRIPVLYTSAAAKAEPPFQWGDEIIACTDPANNQVTTLKLDPRYKDNQPPDYFEYRRRAQELAGKPMKVRVRRAAATDPNASPEEVEITVPPAYHYTFGLRMKMGRIMAVRDDSPAAKAGVQPNDATSEPKIEGDQIVQVVAVAADGKETVWTNEASPPKEATVKELDPMRLPYELAKHGKPKEVRLTVLRTNKEKHNQERKVLTIKDWDERYRFDNEVPLNGNSPVAIPELGLAFAVETTVDAVRPGSPADTARSKADDGLKIEKGDVIAEVCPYLPGKDGEEAKPVTKRKYLFWTVEAYTELPSAGWPSLFWKFQHRQDVKELNLRVKRGEKTFDVHLTADPADGKSGHAAEWPTVDRGMNFMPELRLHKAKNMGEAIDFGFSRAFRFVGHIYLQLKALATGRLSIKLMSGPIGIAATAYEFADMDLYMLVLFLGIISVNLAVVNFLPIPLLDGGHMVFLIYEGLRGKPASEAVRIGATYVGLAVIGCLMLFVICIDVGRYWW